MSVTGYEFHDEPKLKELIGEYFDDSFTDALGNYFFVKKCGKNNVPKILIDVHMDEIGMIVTDIKENGFITVTNIGGVDTRILQGSDVIIYGKEKIFGVVGSTPPHLQKADETDKLKEIGELLIDTGYDTDELRKLIRIGTPVGFSPQYAYLANNRIAGKGFDDKACAACAVKGIGQANKEELAGDVWLMLSSREEVSSSAGGAAVGAYIIDPDYAMVVDVNLAATPNVPQNESVDFGGGPSLTLGPVTDRKLTKMVGAVADQNDIKWQKSVSNRGTGTNAPDINLTLGGIPCVDVGLPLKCMHTGVELLDIKDAEDTAKLIRAFVCSRNIAEVFSK